MKGIRLFFAVLLVPLAFQAAFADEEIDTSRAATRRSTTTAVSTNRQKPINTEQKQTPQQTTTASRVTNTIQKANVSVRERQPVTQQTGTRSGNTVSESARTTATSKTIKGISSRQTSNAQQRTQSAPSRVTNRTTTPINTGATTRTGTRTPTSSRAARITSSKTGNANRATTAKFARSGTITPTIDTIQSRNYSACRNLFYECMDEFCANKDTVLKRCACSSRINDFDKTKEQLSKVEDKLMDFSQRLLTVNMDKEDAMALNTATEGEIAYSQDDRSQSKKMLDNISKKLNSSFKDEQFSQNLNAISLSLNTDAAFDSVDSLMGASTTTKSGTDLYEAALPVCREMAMEICTSEDLALAESGYQMSIAQDCNTVAKSYESQNEQARAKILESSALLDMSRLDIHQKRNADDILTCKKKMLDMLTDRSVCGEKMSKCLDITGQYIDPTTGEAFLSTKLADLTKLISRPQPDKTWVKTPGNDKFVSFLNSKKVYLEPAMESCQDISTYVWDAFIEDALSQIKLAQDAKLEELRTSCTTLTTQCLSNATKTITDFDARALSVFGVKADITINAMCNDIQETCTALINATQTSVPDGKTNDWTTGMTEITTTKTYETILSTCREVGKNCIIQTCSAISGNFGLCENIDTSINRKSIISRRACWNEVKNCIRDAGTENIAQIMKQYNRIGDGTATYYQTGGDVYKDLYGFERKDVAIVSEEEQTQTGIGQFSTTSDDYTQIHDWCAMELFNGTNTAVVTEWQICRLAEQIWGNCEDAPDAELTTESPTNRILINSETNNETLLSWFARNTNTADKSDSCRDTSCGYGTKSHQGTCRPTGHFSSDGAYCPTDPNDPNNNNTRFTVKTDVTNCCTKDKKYDYGGTSICCTTSKTGTTLYENFAGNQDHSPSVCAKNATAVLSDGTQTLFCVGIDEGTTATVTYTDNGLQCNNGSFIWIHNQKQIYNHIKGEENYDNGTTTLSISNYYRDSNGITQTVTSESTESIGHFVDITKQNYTQ